MIHLGSFSKSSSRPGLRVGWMAALPEVRGRLQIAAESVVTHPSQPGAVAREPRGGGSEHWSPRWTGRRALQGALDRHGGGAHGVHAGLGILDHALRRVLHVGHRGGAAGQGHPGRGHRDGVALVPGSASYMDGRGVQRRAGSRLGRPPRIREGVKRFAEALRSL
ncbi:hypothetical protein QJS66_12340 [Kocuria rhizophila]|nr:hypothetical protein QJS66_12340 [Kocuria rhizophila]